MKTIGTILIAIGFLGGAFLSSLDKDHVRWAYFVPALGLGFGGVLLVGRARNQVARSSETLCRNRRDLETSLDCIVTGLSRLNHGIDPISPHAIRFEIDRGFREDLARFAEARQSMAHLYGLRTYADIMSAFAAGERYLNRVWSASADGYAQEVRAYLGRAEEQFTEAQAKLSRAARG